MFDRQSTPNTYGWNVTLSSFSEDFVLKMAAKSHENKLMSKTIKHGRTSFFIDGSATVDKDSFETALQCSTPRYNGGLVRMTVECALEGRHGLHSMEVKSTTEGGLVQQLLDLNPPYPLTTAARKAVVIVVEVLRMSIPAKQAAA